jgi:hypothetical protein
MFNQKISIMSLRDLLESGANVSVTVTLDDLRTIFHEAAKGARSAVQEQPAEEFLTRKDVLALLKIDSSTLWCWEKTGYIKSYPFGGRKRYKREDVEAIRTGKKGGRDESR